MTARRARAATAAPASAPAPHANGAERWTYERYVEIPDDGERYEIIDGELYVTAAPLLLDHQRPVGRLTTLLTVHADAHDLGEVFVSPADVILPPRGDIVQPDVIFVAKARVAELAQRHAVVGAPDLLVEILSRSTSAYDRSTKRDAYALAGVPHFWILAPRTKSLEAYELQDRQYKLTGRYAPEQSFEPSLFPGLRISIAELWR